MICSECNVAMRPVGNHPHFRCLQCGAYHFPEGTGDGVSVIGEPVGAACPVCHLPLQSALIEKETVCYCDRCHGFLTPMDSFGRIVSARRARHVPNEQRTAPFDPAELQRVLQCPDCSERMDAHPYSGGGNAVVDTCENCNLIWLDAGELAVIERYISHVHRIEPSITLPGGGLDSAIGVLNVMFPGPRGGLFPLDELL